MRRPIGVFDSGFGGLTVARALIDLLPDEDLVYIGDTARYPYGPRPLDQVRSFARQITHELVEEHDAKLVIVACNTASAAALDELQTTFPVPVIGVIEPGVRSLVAATRSGRVGVIGTVGTIGSGAYQQAVAGGERCRQPHLCGLSRIRRVRGARRDLGDQVYVLAERLLAPLQAASVDTLLLGCTHYPFLARTISDVMGREVVLVSSADETAFAVRSALDELGLADRSRDGQGGRHRWISSGDVASFQRLGRQLLGPELDVVEPLSWDERADHDETDS